MDEINLYYKLYNISKDPNKPWMVFLAGYTATTEVWHRLCDILVAEYDYSILLIDNLGSGNSPQPVGVYSSQKLATYVTKVIDKLNINHFYLVGHSMGGAVAQHIALTCSGRIDHLFLVSTFAKLDTISTLLLIGRYELLKSGISREIIAPSLVATLFGEKFIFNKDNQEFAKQRIISSQQSLDGMYGQLNACLSHDTRLTVQQISCRTTIVTGGDDILVHPRHSLYLKDKISDSNFIEISDIGHMVQLEGPELLSKVIIDQIGVI